MDEQEHERVSVCCSRICESCGDHACLSDVTRQPCSSGKRPLNMIFRKPEFPGASLVPMTLPCAKGD